MRLLKKIKIIFLVISPFDIFLVFFSSISTKETVYILNLIKEVISLNNYPFLFTRHISKICILPIINVLRKIYFFKIDSYTIFLMRCFSKFRIYFFTNDVLKALLNLTAKQHKMYNMFILELSEFNLFMLKYFKTHYNQISYFRSCSYLSF